MANKLVVIPEEVYASLIGSTNVFQSGLDTRLLETNRNLVHSLRGPSNTNTEKYLAHDQSLKQLRNLLGKRNTSQSLETMLANLLIKQLSVSGAGQTSSSSQTIGEAPSMNLTTTQTAADDSIPSSSEFNKEMLGPNVSQPLKPNIDSVPLSDAEAWSQPPAQQIIQEITNAPSKKMEAAMAKVSVVPTGMSDVDQLMNMIMSHPDTYGVTPDGRILRSKHGKPFSKPDLRSSITYILGETSLEPPPGTGVLRLNLLAEPTTAEILHGYEAFKKEAQPSIQSHSVKQEQVQVEFKPVLWEPPRTLSPDRKRKMNTYERVDNDDDEHRIGVLPAGPQSQRPIKKPYSTVRKNKL